MLRQGAGWQQGGRQQGACTQMGWQQVEAQQQGRQTTAVQDVGQQAMGRQQPSCRPHGSQQMGLRQGSQMGRVQRGTQVTGRHTVVWQVQGRQQQGSRQQQGWQQQGWQQPPPQPEEQVEPQQEPVMVVSGAGLGWAGERRWVFPGVTVVLPLGPFIYSGQEVITVQIQSHFIELLLLVEMRSPDWWIRLLRQQFQCH